MPVFGVITKVPDPLTGGNLALPDELYIEAEPPSKANDFNGRYTPLHEVIGVLVIALRAPIFRPGEILLLDGPFGREIGSPGRKPSKWDVECEEFDALDDAVRRSEEVQASDAGTARRRTAQE